MSDTVFGLHAKVSADVSPFNQAMDSSATSVSSSLSSIHDAAKMFIGSGVVRTFIKATEAAYKFGQSMADISAISDLNIKSLSKSIMQLPNVYGKAATAADSIYEIISSGVRGTEKDYIDAIKHIGQASVSMKADLYDTTNVITTLLNAYGMSANEVGRIADMLFVTVREGKAHGNELAKTLGLVTNTAAEAGVTLEEMTAVISILSRTQSPSQSMIGFNQMLNGLIKPTQEATAEAERWGIEIGATALQTKGLTAILTEMHEKIGGNVEAINKILGNIRAMRAGVSLTGRQFENFIDVLNQAKAEIGTGVAMEAFSKQTDTAKQSLENLKTQLDKTFIGIGKDLEPITRWMAGVTEEFLKATSAANGLSSVANSIAGIFNATTETKNTVSSIFTFISKSSVYITAIGLAIKGAVTGLKTLSDVHKHLTASTDKTNKASKQYADHMERAKNAATATVTATASIDKNIESKIAKFTTGKPLGSEVIYQSRPYVPQTITKEQRAKVLTQMQERLATAKENVRQAQAQHTPNVRPYYEAQSSVRRASASRDAAQNKFMDDVALRKEAQRILADKQWAASNLVSQLPHSQRNSKYGVDLQKTLDAQLAKAKADVQIMVANETKSRELYYKSEKALVDAEGRFQKASTAYAQSVGQLKKAQSELQSMAKAERAVVTSYRNNPITDDKSTTDISKSSTVLQTTTKQQKTQKYEVEYQQHLAWRNKALQRFNRRFDKSYKSLDQAQRAVDFKKAFKGIGIGLSKFATGLFNVTSLLAAWETGWAIGTTIAEKLKIADWALTQWIADLTLLKIPGSTRREEEENNKHNLKLQKMAARALADKLNRAGKLTDAEHAHLIQTIELTKSQEELKKHYDALKSKDTDKEPPKPPKTEAQIREEGDKATKEAVGAARAGKYKARGDAETQIKELIAKQDLPEHIKEQLYKELVSPEWQDVTPPKEVPKARTTKGKWALLWDYMGKVSRGESTKDHEIKDAMYGKQRREVIRQAKEIRAKETKDRAIVEEQAATKGGIDTTYKNLLADDLEKFKKGTTPAYVEDTKAIPLYAQSLATAENHELADKLDLLHSRSATFDKRVAEYEKGVADLEARKAEMVKDGISTEKIKDLTAAYTNHLDTLKNNLKAEQAELMDIAKDVTNLPEVIAQGWVDMAYRKGVDTSSESFLKQHANRYSRIAVQDLQAKKGETDLERELRFDRVRKFQEVSDTAFSDMLEGRESLRQSKVSAGMMTESGAARGEISDIQESMARLKDYVTTLKERQASTKEGSADYIFITNRIADAQKKLQDTSIKLRGAFNKLAESSNEARSGLMDTVKTMAGAENRLDIKTLTELGGKWTQGAAGRMSNDALWHSMNLASRMGGMVRSQPYMVSTQNLPNRRRTAQLRDQAQGAISASVDSWIMSQKYAQANVGKTVTDIYSFMKQNNIITVRNK